MRTPCAFSFLASIAFVCRDGREVVLASLKAKLAGPHRSKHLFEHLPHLRGANVSENGDDAILRHEITIAKSKQILLRQSRDGVGRPFRPQCVGMLAERARRAEYFARPS